MFKPQLSSDAVNLKEQLRFPVLASVKLDGIRAVTKFQGVLSRSLKPIPNHHIQGLLAPYQDLDGELIVGPANAEDVYRVTSSAVRSEDGKPEFTFYVFDDISVESLKQPFEQRLATLQARNLPDFIQVLPQSQVNSTEELASFYETVLADGYEGLIIRNPKSLYKFGRCTEKSQDSLKLKPFADSDFEVLSVYEAMENNNEVFTNELGRTDRSSHKENLTGNGMAGGFEARDCKTGVEFRVAAGTLNHEQRRQVWEKRSEILGKFGKYRHMTVGVKDKPRFPRFIGWREKFDMGE